MHGILLRLRRSIRTTADKGASAVEYGLMVAAIAAVIVGTVFALGGFVKNAFEHTCESIRDGASVTSDPGCNGGTGGTGGTGATGMGTGTGTGTGI
jgi:pilus assembly protein Flp/PilA